MKSTHATRRIVAALLCVAGMVVASNRDASAQGIVPRPRTHHGRHYKVKIDSAPQQAAIYLDDTKYGIVGYTPWRSRLQKGRWKVIIEKDGYKTATRIINIRRTWRVQSTFIPLVKKVVPAVLDVRGDSDKNAVGAKIWVDGELKGQIPAAVKVSAGRHLVEIKRDGFRTFSDWVTVNQGDHYTISPMLHAKKAAEVGSVLVDADVKNAHVYVDGVVQKDTTPTLVNNLPAGPHVIEVRKKPAMPWKTTVRILAGKTVKVLASLKATIGGGSGTVKVLSNTKGALVYLDGTEVGPAPREITDIKPGRHEIEVKAKGYVTRDKEVKVSAGSAELLKMDLRAGGGNGTLKIVSPVPEAMVYIDGEKIGTVPKSRQLPSGEHFVVVTKDGYKKFQKKVSLEPGQDVTVTAVLKAAGGIRFLSTPSGASVVLDGVPIGKTPLLKDSIDVGEHVVAIEARGYEDFQKTLTVSGGKLQVVNATLQAINNGPTVEEIKRQQRGLTSFSARALPRGRSTVDVAAGYPYYLDGRITVGAGDLGNDAFDAGVFFRTFFSRSELGVDGRLTLFDQSPFAFGAFSTIGGGSNFIDNSGRNTFFFNAGLAASLSAISDVTVSGRAYLNVWSDRHCPALQNGKLPGDPIQLCKDYKAGTISASEKQQVDDLLHGADIFGRENGVRLMTGLSVEVAILQRWNVWVLFEGAPFQKERAAYTSYFNSAMFDQDTRSYFRIGTTLKF